MVFTHDAMGDGEDGPTHQPVEQLDFAARHSRPGRASARRTPTRSSRLIGTSCNFATSRRCSRCRARRCRHSIAANMHPPPAWRAAPMSWRTRPAASPEIILIASGSEVALVVEAHDDACGAGDSVARRVDAVLGHFRAATPVISRRGPAARVKARIAVEQGSTARLGPLCRARRPGHRHEDFRRLGAAQGIRPQVRFRTRPGRRCRHGASRTQLTRRSLRRWRGYRAGSGATKTRTSMLDKSGQSAQPKAAQQTASAAPRGPAVRDGDLRRSRRPDQTPGRSGPL